MRGLNRKSIVVGAILIILTVWLVSKVRVSVYEETMIQDTPYRFDPKPIRGSLYHQAEATGRDGLMTLDKAVDTPVESIPDGQVYSFKYEDVIQRATTDKIRMDAIRHDKWILVTTIAAPTPDIKYLAEFKGWKVLIVADSKTPTDWSHPNCIFLGVDRQKELGYNIVPITPFRNYARKNIGYLYAVAHGAKVIYETDDDNRPTDRLKSFVLTKHMSGLMFAGQRIFNPYRHFGQSTLWPRGFPLSKIGAFSSNDYRLSAKWKTPSVQQGAVNGDPDMDAVFRLTRKFTTKKLDVVFDQVSPPVILPEGVFCPYNAQDTMYLLNAFWSLYLPLSPSIRVTDIWRSYWAQRLLWEIDERMAYFPPNAYQQRNAHDYLWDYAQELQLYSDTEALLDFLYLWNCPPEDSFFQCVYRLTVDMAKQGFWKESDGDGVRRWLDDLVRVGYTEPQRRKPAPAERLSVDPEPSINQNLEKLRQDTISRGSYVHFVAEEQMPPTINRMGATKSVSALQQVQQIFSLCNNVDSLKIKSRAVNRNVKSFFADILLVVVFNNPHYQAVPMLEVIYRSVFPNMVYCGTDADSFFRALNDTSLADKVSFMEMDSFRQGRLGYRCMSQAMAMSLNVSGYLVVADDDIINLWKFFSFSKERVWTYSSLSCLDVNDNNVSWPWWGQPEGKSAYMAAFDQLRHWTRRDTPKGVTPPAKFLENLARNTRPSPPSACYAVSDIYYVPQRLKTDVQFYMNFFLEHRVFLELAVPAVLRGVEEDAQAFHKIRGVNLYRLKRPHVWERYDDKIAFLHPVKFSNATNLKSFCSLYLPMLHKYTHAMEIVDGDAKAKSDPRAWSGPGLPMPMQKQTDLRVQSEPRAKMQSDNQLAQMQSDNQLAQMKSDNQLAQRKSHGRTSVHARS